MFGLKINKCGEKPEREAIHSGHFMVSHFEAEAQDDEDELAVPLPETAEVKIESVVIIKEEKALQKKLVNRSQLGIDGSLTKLFQCMSLAYRQKLTSPKWNRFRGIRLRWKDKIRLNNVIWRCWHLQFIKKENTLICQFASPLDVDTHNKPEAVVLEGKYWKRKLAAVTAEYKKWRMFYRNQLLGHARDTSDMLTEMELMAWDTPNTDDCHMMVDEDYMGLMSDTLFSTITNQPFPFPDTRELAKAGWADFIQPSLGPLQPNLDDYMDTFEPLHDLISEKLPTVPEENPTDYKQGWYPVLDLLGANTNLQMVSNTNNTLNTYQIQPLNKEAMPPDMRIQPYDPNNRMASYAAGDNQLYNSSVISKDAKSIEMNSSKLISQNYEKTVQNTFGGYNDTSTSLHSEQKIQESRVTDMSSYGIPQQVVMSNSSSGYKFPQPTTPNVKFASHPSYKPVDSHKEEKLTARPRVVSTRGRQRSRSNTREPLKKPPLTSAVSDPSLINSSNSALLTQLLTNNDNSNTFTQNHRMNSSHDNLSLIRIKDEQANHSVPILPQPQPTTLIITSVNMNPMNATLNMQDPLLLNMSASNSPILDSNQSLNSPTSSQGSIGSPTRDGSNRDNRRVGNIHAEQKRRYNIKNGFDRIHSLIPHLNQNPNAKLSKAAMLQKGAEYIKQLRSERNLLKDEMDTLRQQIEVLNTSISNCQSLLPATGAPVSRRRDDKMQEMFDDYVRTRTLEDWKFWIFSLLFRPLLASFNNFVSTSSVEDLYRSTLLWVEQHCTLVDLRPVVLNSLRYLCTKTDILSEPEKLPEETRQIVLTNQQQQQPM